MQGRSADLLDQRLDRLISRGRDFVDGVSGARPGARSASGGGRREGTRRAGWRGELEGLGRWVENGLDRFLDDEADWREPWQEGDVSSSRGSQRPVGTPASGALVNRPARRPSSERRALEAISRRGQGVIEARPETLRPGRAAEPSSLAQAQPPGLPGAEGAEPERDSWPDDASFTVPRWSRPAQTAARGMSTGSAAELAAGTTGRAVQAAAVHEPSPRPLPRSSRRRNP